ncbi:hypothetical protein E4U53_000670 [Claviceps sorghi]|nr:hypothetical protein E4U53_000670 [Claviceps sorghi]
MAKVSLESPVISSSSVRELSRLVPLFILHPALGLWHPASALVFPATADTPTREPSSMVSPGSSIALLLLGILALCGIVYWFCKVRVDEYVEALFSYRRKLARGRREAAAGGNAASSESA